MKQSLLTTLLVMCLGVYALAQDSRPPQPKPSIDLNEGDRVVFLGDTFMEREQTDGYIETRLTSRHPGKKIIFRNLGWSADTVLGESRAGFDSPEKGFDRLKEHLTAVKPNVVFLSHGMAASFAGEQGIPKFVADVNTLMETVTQISGASVRFVILGPIHHEDLGAPLPDGKVHNAQLKLYNIALQDIATARKAIFISLFDLTAPYEKSTEFGPLTENGIHLNAYGYWRIARLIDKALGFATQPWVAKINTTQESSRFQGFKIRDLKTTPQQATFVGADEFMMPAPIPTKNSKNSEKGSGGFLGIRMLEAGSYTLLIDGEPIETRPHTEWMQGKEFHQGGGFSQIETIRETIVKKNQLYFYRWRPQNETYLFGFRKHEQGRNAREIPMFDPLVSEEESKIFLMNQPKEHAYELSSTTEDHRTKLVAKPTTKTPAIQVPFKQTFEQPVPTFDLDPELEVTLFAENPELAKPIHMNFDPQGRLWVASSSVYPQIEPGQKANDKILILEDSDRDGKADKSTVFADGLLIPTGVEPGDGGVYVANSTELVHFKDTDGDGRANVKRVMLSGFGTEDTHHILHTLRWGHDGQLYMNQSIYIHSHVETPHGVVRLNSGGIWNFRPTTRELGIHAKGWVNSWGHHFDQYGQSFVTDGAGGEGINWAVPQAMYVTYAGARRILGSVSPGSYPKFCGIEVIESQHFPEAWQGSIVTCDFRAHRVVRFAINELETGYVTKALPDVMRTTNVTFRPIDAKVGPDGALYIADWSNPIIQHGEVDFRDPRRDHEHGRIWRVTAKGRRALAVKDYAKMGNKELLDELLSPNNYNRQRARRVLTEKGAKIQSDLASWTKAHPAEKDRLEALWMYQSIDIVNADLLKSVLNAEDGKIRAAGTRVLSFWRNRIPSPLDLMAERVSDVHPRVRMEAVRALSKVPSLKSAELVLSVLEKPVDKYLDYATWLSVNDLAEPWLEGIKSGAWKIDGHEKQLTYGLKAIQPQQASSVLTTVLPQGTFPKDGSGPWIELIAQAGTGPELKRLFDQILNAEFDEMGGQKSLNALNEAARNRGAKPVGDLSPLNNLLVSASPTVQESAIRLAGGWKQANFSASLMTLASNKGLKSETRQLAFQSIREIGGGEAVQGLNKLAAPGNEMAIRISAVLALAGLDINQAVGPAINTLGEIKNEAEALALWRGLLANKGAAGTFAQALPKNGFAQLAAKTGLRVTREGGRNEPSLILALARNLDAEGETHQLTAEELKTLVNNISKSGDPARGELIYRRPELGCVGCHSIAGVGGKVGPDMTSLGASAPIDYLIESMQFPNRKVKEGYHSIQVETKDNQELSGILVRENKEQLVLRDAANQEVSVAVGNIVKKSIGGSLMPSGLMDGLSAAEQLDVFRFLSELGKPGAFDGSKSSVARVWKLLPQTIDIAQFGDEKVVQQSMTEKGWIHASTLVDGRLLKSDLVAALNSVTWRNPEAVFIGTQLQVPKDGSIRIKFDNLGKAPVWIDGKLIPNIAESEIPLKAGTHRIITKLSAKNLPENFRMTSVDGTFLTQ